MALIEYRLGQAGHAAMGFAVHVPHYLARAEYPQAARVLVDHLAVATGLYLPTASLTTAAERAEREIAEQVEGSEEVAQVVAALERQYDTVISEGGRAALPTGGELPTADELAAEVERFLAGRDDDTEDRDRTGATTRAPNHPADRGSPPTAPVRRTRLPATAVEFFFDPLYLPVPPGAPPARITEVADAGAATVTWRLMSLGVLNECKEIPEKYREGVRQGGRALRVLAAAQAEGGSDAVARLYTALGTHRHEKGEASDDASIAAAVAEAGLPESVAAAVDDESLDAAVRAEHEASQAAVGDTAGSPVVALEGRGFFGPVVVPAPTGDQALQLFEAVRLIAGVPAFSELKTARNPF